MPSDRLSQLPQNRLRRPVPVVVVGPPQSRRIAAIRDAAHRAGGLDLTVIAYPDALGDRYAPPAGSVVRLESPSECDATLRAFLKAGIVPMEASGRTPVGVRAIEELASDRGAILHPLQWYLGFRRELEALEGRWHECGVRWMSAPRAVAFAFDKLACLDRWSAAGLPVPPRPSGASTYGDLRRDIAADHARLIIKLRYGYSAMGAVALEWRGSLVRAITTVEVVWSDGRPRLFVSKRPRVLRREFEIAWLIDTLGMEGILVEEWLPKARWNGRPFDLRLVTIGGAVRHVVGRAGSSPFTNLNLDAVRIPRDAVLETIGDAWPEVRRTAEQAAATIPDAGMLGLDVLVRPCRKRFALLEANAFGDYLPGLTHCGLSTYEAQFRNLLESREAIA